MSAGTVSAPPVDLMVGVPGGRVFARRWAADGGRTPLILLHDSLGSVDQWRDFPPALAAATGRSVAAYDRLGFGRSTPHPGPADARFIEREAEVFLPVIAEALGMPEFALFGHSVGGAMALAAAAWHPARCRAVVTAAAQAFVEPRTRAGIQAAKAAFGDPAQFAKLAKWHGEKAPWVLGAWTEIWLSPDFQGWSLDSCLGRVRCPVLAIHGERDEFGSEAFPRRIVESVRGPAELELLAGCGHVPHRERREAVLRLTASFLERHG